MEVSVCECGRASAGDAGYCRYCGSFITRVPAPVAPEPPAADEPDGRRRWQFIALAGVAVVAVVGATVLAQRGSGAAHAPAAPAPAAHPAGRALAGSPLEPEVRALTAWVEGARGLKFDRPPTVRLLNDAAVRAQADRLAAAARAKGGAAEHVLRAMGAVPTDLDLDGAGDALAKGGVGATYDPSTHVLAVADQPLTPPGRAALVRELVRALDDQRFGIATPAIGIDSDERALASSALVEGDAARIRAAYVAGLPAPERDQVAAQDLAAASGLGKIPTALRQLLSFPYDAGMPFVQSLLAAGGQARLDGAFRKPPVTTEQVLHPDRYAAGEGARKVATPTPKPGRVLARGSAGELGLRLLFEAVGDPALANTAAAGWGGDRFVAWRSDFKTCIVANVVMDSGADRNELVDALNRWDGRQPDSSVEAAGDAVTVRACR